MPEFPDTSESLIAQVRDRTDADAWERFEQLYRPVIFRIARSKGLQHSDALDLVQQVLVSVAVAIPKYQRNEAKTPFRHWLNRVTRNAILKSLQQSTREKPTGGTQVLEVLQEVPADDPTMDSLIETEYQREIYSKAADAVRQDIADSTWFAFELTVVQQKSIEHAARVLDLSPGSVYAARSRVIRRLRDTVEQIERGDALRLFKEE